MKRSFYLTITACKHLEHAKPDEIIDYIFPHSDIKEHLAYKLRESLRYEKGFSGISSFYEKLDDQHQYQFDNYVNELINRLDGLTSGHLDLFNS